MSENKIILGSDADGVLAYSQLPIIEEAKKRFGLDLHYKDWTSHDLLFYKAIELSGELPATIAAWLFSNEVMGKSSPIPGSKEAIRYLNTLAHIHIITGRPGAQRKTTEDWARKHFPSIQHVHLREEESPEKSNEFKKRTLQELQADVFIEDDDRMIQVILDALDSGYLSHLKIVFLMDRPWNQSLQVRDPVRRVGNWRKDNFGWKEVVNGIARL